MHYYQWNIGDYAAHSRYLSMLEDLAYRRLLDQYYLQELPLKNSPKILARSIGMADNIDEVTHVLETFFDLVDGLWVSKRADDEIAKYQAKADAARANGKKGGRPKKPTETQPVILANPEATGSEANHKPLTINQEPIKEHTSSSTKSDSVPYQKIVDCYHDKLPMMPAVKKLTEARKKHIKARWHEARKAGKDIEYFNGLFGYVAQSDFLVGNTDKPFTCNLEWLMKESNFVKVIEGNYHNV